MALSEYMRPIAYCEIDPYCQSVLLSRMQVGNLPKAPIWDDVRTLPYEELPRVDIIYGGFPCTDISIAGNGKGLEGEQSGLFFEIVRLAKEIKPAFLFLENVPAITTRGGLQVVNEIASLGYDCRWCVISAASVGALHKRERWFLLAHTQGEGLERFGGESGRSKTEQSEPSLCCQNDSNTNSISGEQADSYAKSEHTKRQPWGEHSRFYRPFKSRDDWQKTLGEVGCCIDGISARLDFNKEQLKALGNAVVPQQVRKAWMILMGLNDSNLP